MAGRTIRGAALCLLVSLGTRAASAQEVANEPAPTPEEASSGTTEPPGAAAPAVDSEAATRELEAKQHFSLGSTFYDSGRFEEAAEEFAEAFRLSGRPQLLYNVYVAQRDAGDLEQAVDALASYLKAMPNAPDRINLRARLRSMEAQLAARERGEPELAAPAPPPPTATASTERSIVPWVLLGTGGALLGASIGTGIAAKSGADALDDSCDADRNCPPSEQKQIDKTMVLAVSTDVLWALGAGAAITGLVLRLTGALDPEQPTQVALSLDGQTAGMSLSGRF